MANEKQTAYWNEVAGPKWVKIAHEMDARFAGITELLLQDARAQPAMSILDIGCGTGAVTAEFAKIAGAQGSVTGVDISEPMLEVARGATRDMTNLKFLNADAQTYDFGPARFDLAVSRFGVMFFEDPVAAFANILTALKPGGRICFICWAPLAENPHWLIPFEIVAGTLGMPAEKPKHAPGPMAFSDSEYLSGVLARAGFADIIVTPAPVMIVGETIARETQIAMILGPSGALLDEKQADPKTREALAARIAAALARFDGPDGMKLPAGVYVVNAVKSAG